MTSCNTLLCGNEAVWQLLDNGGRGKPTTIYKCDLCYERNRLHNQEGWTRIVSTPSLLASRVRSYYNQNV